MPERPPETPPTLPKRTRDTIARMEAAFDKVDALLFRLGQQGLQRMSRSSVTELQALSQTAHNGALIRIERELDRLATQVERYLDRDPAFTVMGYMATVNRIWLLNARARRMRAEGLLPEAMKGVIGSARRTFTVREEPLLLQPIGASGWVTDTDFVGVTVYFYAVGHDGILLASNARPAMYFGTDPRRLLHSPISDYVQATIWEMSHGAYQFTRAKISDDGRLSLHKELEVENAPWFGAQAYAALAARNWIALVDRLRGSQVDPIRGPEPVPVYLEPRDWGPVEIDQKTQRAHATLTDETGATLRLQVPLRPENNFLIDNLEILVSTLRPDGIFGHVSLSDGTLVLMPITAIYHEAVSLAMRGNHRVHEVHLSLESLGSVTR